MLATESSSPPLTDPQNLLSYSLQRSDLTMIDQEWLDSAVSMDICRKLIEPDKFDHKNIEDQIEAMPR